MPTYITDQDLETELAGTPKPMAYQQDINYPLNSLSDRQFECLIQDIFRSLALKKDDSLGRFDTAILMNGVGERGRDCALLLENRNVGVVQCKRYESLLTKPAVAQVIIKFCLHAVLDSALIPDATEFHYTLAVSNDFSGPAKTFLSNFNATIDQEPSLDEWISEVIQAYKAFSAMHVADVREEILYITQKIRVRMLAFNEINTLMASTPTLLSKYFLVKTVVSEEILKPLASDVAKIAGQIADSDVQTIIRILQKQPKDRRFDFGSFSLWGYQKGFVDELFKSGKFGPVATGLVKAKADLDAAALDYINRCIADEVLKNITHGGKFSPFTLQAAHPYVFGKLAERWQILRSGKTISAFPSGACAAADSATIRQRLLIAGEKFLRGDYNDIVGDLSLRTFKIDVLKHVHRGFSSVEEMAEVFDSDWPEMVPKLEQIARSLESLLPEDATIVLRDLSWFDNADHVSRVLEAARQRQC